MRVQSQFKLLRQQKRQRKKTGFRGTRTRTNELNVKRSTANEVENVNSREINTNFVDWKWCRAVAVLRRTHKIDQQILEEEEKETHARTHFVSLVICIFLLIVFCSCLRIIYQMYELKI